MVEIGRLPELPGTAINTPVKMPAFEIRERATKLSRLRELCKLRMFKFLLVMTLKWRTAVSREMKKYNAAKVAYRTGPLF